jgi:tetratricopeptide (TPR) repeat protein
MDCERITNDEITEKYLRNELSEADQEAFEQHYFECARCFEGLQALRALGAALQQSAPAIRAERVALRVFSRWAWAAVAAGVLLMVGFGLWLRRQVPVAPTPRAPVVQSPKVEEHPPPGVPSLGKLARVQPPTYVPATLRGPTDEAAKLFREAMRHYVKGDYGAAILGLRAASKLNPKAADISFFLGICYLLTEQTDSAVKHLRSIIALGDSPYLEDAHFFLAKAYLREADLALARSELEKTTQLRGDREAEARELIQQVKKLDKGPH